MRSDAAKLKDNLYLLLRLSLLLTLSQPGSSHLGQGDGTEHKARNLPSYHSWAPNQHCDCGQVIRSLWGIKAYLLMKWIGFVLVFFSLFFFPFSELSKKRLWNRGVSLVCKNHLGAALEVGIVGPTQRWRLSDSDF